MIKIHELTEPHSRVCDGCGKKAVAQLVALTRLGTTPHANAVDLCHRCAKKVHGELKPVVRR